MRGGRARADRSWIKAGSRSAAARTVNVGSKEEENGSLRSGTTGGVIPRLNDSEAGISTALGESPVPPIPLFPSDTGIGCSGIEDGIDGLSQTILHRVLTVGKSIRDSRFDLYDQIPVGCIGCRAERGWRAGSNGEENAGRTNLSGDKMKKKGDDRGGEESRGYNDVVYPIAITLSRTSFQSSRGHSAKIFYGRFKSSCARGGSSEQEKDSSGAIPHGSRGTGNSVIRYKWQIRCSMYARNISDTGCERGRGKFIGPARRTDVLSDSFYWTEPVVRIYSVFRLTFRPPPILPPTSPPLWHFKLAKGTICDTLVHASHAEYICTRDCLTA